MSVSADISTVRVPTAVLDQAEQLRTELQGAPEYRGLALTKAAIIRMAIVAGLAVLEARRAAGAAVR